MSLLPEPDVEELAIASAILRRPQTYGEGWIIKRWTESQDHWGGQRYAVVVEPVGVRGVKLYQAALSTFPLYCQTAQRDAMRADGHEHGDGCQYANGEANRSWLFADLTETLVAALRWEPSAATEPFGWLKALDGSGRIRRYGDPLQESVARPERVTIDGIVPVAPAIQPPGRVFTTGGISISATTNTVAPPMPQIGDLAVDPSTGGMQQWTGSRWVRIR